MKLNQMLIPASIVVAFILQIMPMPASIDVYRPDWLLLILCYWTMALPNRVGVGATAVCGIVLDVLYGTSLGVHSFAMAIPVYLVAANYQRFRNYSVVQQAIMIFILSMLYHMVVYWLQYWLTGVQFRFEFLWPVITSVFLWPWLFWFLRRYRRLLRVT
ncbi:rod shape-determining protein MreD [Brumicola nitratireducens]|jgi:rod shape-determining protein MreD|uniref:Rod shape-determining protein MreD n=1 Tax=Glaciecola nitratireducens (strain JCM 12485 / KCTC 12276 / FR1064) TaxID=1085623 RepID=G4QFG0_GLANF|nr:rod shape-determining protein MreD [Glaciecola nitratireducens]AEP28504.1 rod shape-determining protein MreD [Glaciecola nitratireducens FR1064]